MCLAQSIRMYFFIVVNSQMYNEAEVMQDIEKLDRTENNNNNLHKQF